jgi:hypothetical protein
MMRAVFDDEFNLNEFIAELEDNGIEYLEVDGLSVLFDGGVYSSQKEDILVLVSDFAGKIKHG